MKRDIKLLPIDRASTITLLDTPMLATFTISFSSSLDRLPMIVGVVDDLRTEAAPTTLLVPGCQNGRPADTSPLNAMVTQNNSRSSICITRIARLTLLLLYAILTAIHPLQYPSYHACAQMYLDLRNFCNLIELKVNVKQRVKRL